MCCLVSPEMYTREFKVYVCVCVLPPEAPACVQTGRVCYGMWLVRSLDVPGNGLAGLWTEVLLPLLW